MGFFSDLKEDLSQAVSELMPDEKAENTESESQALADMLERLDTAEEAAEMSALTGSGEAQTEEDKLLAELFSGGEAADETESAHGFDSMPKEDAQTGTEPEELSGGEADFAEAADFASEYGMTMEESMTADTRTEEGKLLAELFSGGETAGAAESATAEAGTDPNAFTEESAPEAETEALTEESAPEAEAEALTEESAPEAEAEAFTEESAPEAETEAFTEESAPEAETETLTEESAPEAEAEAFTEESAPEAEAEAFTISSVPEAVREEEAVSSGMTAMETEMKIEAEADKMSEELEMNQEAVSEENETEKEGVKKMQEQVFGENEVASDEKSVITEAMTITGDIVSRGSMEVFGTITGNIDILGKLDVTGVVNGNSKAAEIYAESAKIVGEVNSLGSVKVGQSSVIIGNITATSAVIAGAVKGDIDVHGPVILDTSAIVMGNIKSKSVQINNGAVVEGMCSQCYADVNPTAFFDEFKKTAKI